MSFRIGAPTILFLAKPENFPANLRNVGYILLTSSNNQFSEFWISNIYNEILVLIFLMILSTHLRLLWDLEIISLHNFNICLKYYMRIFEYFTFSKKYSATLFLRFFNFWFNFVKFESFTNFNYTPRIRIILAPMESLESHFSIGTILTFRQSIKIHLLTISKFPFFGPSKNLYFLCFFWNTISPNIF